MAPPFCGVATQHKVRAGGKEYFANCAWDALGILAALHAEGEVSSRCEQSLEPIQLRVGKNGPAPAPCVVHFAVPAARWWEGHRLHVKHDALLPVGRTGERMVQGAGAAGNPIVSLGQFWQLWWRGTRTG